MASPQGEHLLLWLTELEMKSRGEQTGCISSGETDILLADLQVNHPICNAVDSNRTNQLL
jgi:hypothetical protein